MEESGEEYTPSESPTLVNIRRRDDIWPPKYSTVRHLPRVGFTPTVMGEAGKGKKFVWPPPKPGAENDVNGVGHLSHGKVQDAWNPEANALGNRPPPFAPRTAPVRRCTDEIWPPRGSEYQPHRGASPKPVKTMGRFEDYIKYKRGPSVPVTYRMPPGTQHIQYTELEGEYIHESKTTTTTTSMSNSTAVRKETHVTFQPQPTTKRIEPEEEEEEESDEE